MLYLDKIKNIKIFLIILALIIAISSLLVSNYLIGDLKKSESQNMEVWAEAMRTLNFADENTDLNLVLKVINGNSYIPVVVFDDEGNIQSHRNLNIKLDNEYDSIQSLLKEASRIKDKGNSIKMYLNSQDLYLFDSSEYGDSISFSSNENKYSNFIEICYDESLMLTRLTYYPYIQLLVVVVFVLVALFALFSSMRSEQNKVWVGLSKETAHQLGTPISSLMAWSEVLRENYPDDILIPEMSKDIKRLEVIAERFSKIGSIPEPRTVEVSSLINQVVDYMNHRTSSKVKIVSSLPTTPVCAKIVAPLFEWVIENLCKNAVDAMNGSGVINILMLDKSNSIIIEVSDTGKGIKKTMFKTVFKPGYTTKKRGWGLGLSLVKRIVEDYHNGKIFVKNSEIGKGTTFRIELNKSVR
jgi:sensor histidine kinase YesM